MRSPASVQAEMVQVGPSGFVWDGTTDDYKKAMFLPAATEMSLIEGWMDAMLPQVDMRTAPQLLPDYLRVLGPDPYGRDLSTLPQDQQALLAYQRWTAGGDICAGYFERLAVQLGTTCTITESICWECGVASCDDEMVPEYQNFVFLVGLPATTLTDWECGVSSCDDSLGGYTPNLMEGAVRAQAPLHTTPVFSYSPVT